ncbi:AlpA family phage regulatory protein [Herbaspirillum lusitanum]|uniref:helix-turn-helix transcriptional regulator n=1 Tax=Herbaspirillum lusitanum TaxID=213312 RepID=UPI002238E6D0|nr:AlpA family phage regulatory protein [Herbaspirillum lusitanum]MCW5299298.1 AlpA family phage regulatory protein [Herbaspirillum lusitanum]
MNSPIKFFLDMHELCIATTLSETTIQKLIREQQFPAPRHLGGRRVGWLVKEVLEWAENRPVSDLPPPPNTGARKPKPKQKKLEVK